MHRMRRGCLIAGFLVWIALPAISHAQTIPSAPTNLQATAASPFQINLTWIDTSTNESGYMVERSLDGINFTQIAQLLPQTATYRDTGAWPGTTYYYRVRAYNTSGDSGVSAIASGATPAVCNASAVAWGWNGYGQTAVPTNLSGVVAVSAGMEDSFVLRSDGTVLGWGDNSYGILTPPAGLTGVVAVSANVASTLALKSDGTMVMWGFEWDQLPNVTGVVAIANGWQHSLALLSDGTVIGWGLNESGQISIPTNLAGVVAIAAGGYHSLALKSDGTVVGWGNGGSGLATPPTNLTGVVAIAAGGHHSLALKSDGTVVGWGDNTYGQATPPAGLTGVTAISAGWQHSLALMSDGTIIGWGDDSNGQISPPAGLAGVTAISAGYLHSLAVAPVINAPSNLTATAVSTNQINLAWTSSGPVDGFNIRRAPDNGGSPGAWTQIATVGPNTTNYNDAGLASNATYWYQLQAFTVCGVSFFTDPASAAVPSVAAPSGLSATGVSAGQINLTWTNNSTTENGFLIERAPDNGGVPGTWTQIASVNSSTTAYSDTGLLPFTLYWYRVRAYDNSGDSVYSNLASAFVPAPCPRYVAGWGYNASGQATALTGLVSAIAIAAFGDGSLALTSDGTVPLWDTQVTPPATLTGVVAIAMGSGFNLALKGDGTVIGSGNDMWGQLTPPAGTTGVVAIAAGGFESLALQSNGILVVWGDTRGVTSLTGIVAMASGDYHSLAVYTNGTVVGWGNNNYGQATSPPGLTGVVAVAVGDYHSLALKSDGTVVQWGTTIYGESVPPAGLSGVVAIAAGGTFSLALKSDGTVVAWGDNQYGESTPPEGLANVIAIAAGWDHSLALSLPCPLSAPSALTATLLWPSQINLSWLNNSFDEDGFKIERAPDNGGVPGTWAQIATVSSNVATYSDTGLSQGVTYWYRVRTYNVAGNSDYSNLTNATILLPPVAPSGLTATPLSSVQISLSWTDTANDETGFAIERAPDTGGSPGTFAQIATVNSNVTAYTDTSLTTNTTYWYRVRASNAGGYSPYSNQADATTFRPPPDSWISLASGKWEAAGSWSLGVPPSILLTGELITNDNSKTVTIDATTVSNSPSTLTISNLTVSAPSGGTNTLLLTTGGSPTPLHVLRGISLGSGGLLDIENSSLQVDANTFWIDGTLLVQNGGQVTPPTRPEGVNQLVIGNVATGMMVVSAGTVVSEGGTVAYEAGSQGTLVISNGATIRLSYLAIAESGYYSTGAVWLSGSELTTTNYGQPNFVFVGQWGAGQMTVSNGMVLSGQAYVGYYPGSCGTLTVVGGSVTLSSALTVGYDSGATGAVWLAGGQLVASGKGTASIGANGAGQLTVTGGTMQASSMVIGQYGGSQGSLTVSGGAVSVLSSLVIGDCTTTASGQVAVAGSGSLFVTNASHTAFLDVRHGTLMVGAGGVLVADRIVATNACGRVIRSSGGTITATTMTLDPSLSAVGDGIPNGWKQQYGFDPFDPNLANEDLDGSGFTVLQDYLAGLDPTNPASSFRITAITPVGTDIRVYFTSVGGKYYSLQRSDFMGGAWTAIATNIPGNDSIQWVKDIGAASRPSAFYRILLEQLTNAPPVDSDGDGVPDWWTQEYFGHPTGQASDNSLATDDPDGTGFTVLQDYLAGLDPTNSASSFRITSVVPSGIDLLVTWTMGPGRTNALQATAGDATGSYNTNDFADIFTVTNTVGTTTNYLDTGAATNFPARYYRVRLIP